MTADPAELLTEAGAARRALGATLIPQEIDDPTLAFPASVRDLMPDLNGIDRRELRRSKWGQLTSDWFFCGLRNVTWKPKKDIDQTKALRHIAAILRSWEPKHEEKEAAVAYLLSLWFKDVTYERGSR
mgnify:CR=1 FL=1